MVAVIHFAKGFNNVLHYNENKVAEQVAIYLDAVNYPKQAQDLSLAQKLKGLEKRASLNDRTALNCVHISLNFDPSEQLSADTLKEIAATYLQQIGFAEQPYLVYQHHDSGHPHIHLVTTNIRADGSRIRTHNLGRIQSEKARKAIEQQYGLLRPEDSIQRQAYNLNPVNAQQVIYGKAATKRAITTVLNKVIPAYKYTSLTELNAVLRQYNIVADRGAPDSKVYKNNGLVYRVLDAEGNKVGVPIKASDFYSKPTLKSIEQRFAQNDLDREKYKGRIKTAIDFSLVGEKTSLRTLAGDLKKQGIIMEVRRNDQGFIYGLTYIDHRTQCVFNGSDLGKQYSAKGVMERCGKQHSFSSPNSSKEYTGEQLNASDQYGADLQNSITNSLIDTLLQEEFTGETMPFDLRRKKRKKKGLSNN